MVPACVEAVLVLQHMEGRVCVLHSVWKKVCDRKGADVATCQTVSVGKGGMSGCRFFCISKEEKNSKIKQ